MRHKKLISLLLALVFAVGILAACGGQEQAPPAAAPATDPAPAATPAPAPPTVDDALFGVAGGWAELFSNLPFQDILPFPDGEVEINGEVRPIRIGFSQTGFDHPWRVEMINSALAQVDRHPNVELIITDGNVDVVKQSSDIDDLLVMGVDAIILSPVEDAGLILAVDRAMAAGIPVILLDRDCSTDKTLFIGQSNIDLGASVAREMVRALTERHGEPRGYVLEITGLPGSSPAIDRQRGFRDVIANYPGIVVLAEGDGQWIREPAMSLMEDWLVVFDTIDAVFSHAEESSWGAELAIIRAGRQGEGIMHFTMDGSNEAFVSVRDGEFMATGNYSPYIGHLGVRAVLYALTGMPFPGAEPYEFGTRLTLPYLPVVTRENVEQWIGHGWGDY